MDITLHVSSTGMITVRCDKPVFSKQIVLEKLEETITEIMDIDEEESELESEQEEKDAKYEEIREERKRERLLS